MVLGCDGREVNLRAERARASSNPTTVSKANSSSSIVCVGVVLYDDAVRRLESLKEVPTLVGTCLSTGESRSATHLIPANPPIAISKRSWIQRATKVRNAAL